MRSGSNFDDNCRGPPRFIESLDPPTDIYIYIYIYIYIQSVPGGMCETSGGCSLC